ncbi:hypothetical protein [Actinoplanes utahensis]|uniref:Uncharacterized protein n=1 Tax=Actinoplanes utahensis TaxID=1869 RepID=A0A0A6UEN6_ACTUT|nr:hypothetical protein [Actinoplanes utahensis]KHD73543.1 hypothetical protein MB27_33985 [Actinoplanes utahensis]GIF33883.1 hypothetical protein Aut01nite_68690 [Actinoplanes utahensis]
MSFMPPEITADRCHGLSRPTVAELRTCLTSGPHAGPQLWSRTCRAAGLDAGTDDPAALQMTCGTAHLAVLSLAIRLRAHTALTSR